MGAHRRNAFVVLAVIAAVGAAACTPPPTGPSKPKVTVTASSATIQFGDPVPVITPSYSGFTGGQTDPATPPVCTTNATPTSPPGAYPTTCSGAADPGYRFEYVAGSITVQGAAIEVTASSDTMTYGGAVPTVSAAYAGFSGGQTEPATLAVCTTTATSTSPVGTYPTSCSGATDPGHTFTYVDGTVTVTPAGPVTVTASSATSSYGDPVPAITPSYGGLVAGDTEPATPAICSTSATSTSPAGTYPTSCSGALDPNYTFAYVDGSVTISPVATPVIVTASSAAMDYGDPVPAITASYSGFVGGQTDPATPPVCTTTATSTSAAGTYPTSCSGAADPNHTFAYVDGTVTVSGGPAPVTVTASSETMTYGGPVPTITAGYAGFTNGETQPATPAVCTTTATSTSPAGIYPSSCSGAVDPGDTFAYVGGIVTVQPAPVAVTATSPTKVYGAAVPAIGATYSGFVGGQTTPATPPTCSTTATSSSPVGSYPSSCSGAADPNHTFSYATGAVAVTAAPVVVTASSSSMTYRGAVPTITAGYAGLVGQSAAATPPVCTTTATSTSAVGAYPTTCSGADDPNHSFTYAAGSVTVSPAAATVTASSGSMAATDPAPAIEPTYGGFLGGQTVPATGATCTTTATSNSAAGTYPSTCSGAADPNYTFTYVPGMVTVTPVGFGEYDPSGHSTTLAAAVNGLTLPRTTINVASTTGFKSTYVGFTVVTSTGPQPVFCTGSTATSFTGCSGGTGTMSTGGYVIDVAASAFDVYTISGGKAAVAPTSLTILADAPAASRGIASTVTATANNGLIRYVQSAAPTGTPSITFGICSTGTPTYSAGDPNCRTGQLRYRPGVESTLGAKVTVSIVTSDVYQQVSSAVVAPATIAQGQTFTAYAAPGASQIPRKQSSSLGDATVNSASGFTAIFPIPNGMTFQSVSLMGGDAQTAGVATARYCPATGTGCTAKLTGNYVGTTLPYIQVSLPGVTVPGGGTVVIPTVALTLTATGPIGTVSTAKLTEFILSTSVNAPIIGNVTAVFDGYPTTGSSGTPPVAPPTPLSSTTITS